MGIAIVLSVLLCTPARAAWCEEKDAARVTATGMHSAEARLDGYVPASQTVKVAKGGKVDVALARSEAQLATPSAKGGEEGAAPGPGAGGPVAREAPAKPVALPTKRSWVPAVVLDVASALGLGLGIWATMAGSNVLDELRVQRQAIADAGGQCARPPAAFVDVCAELNSAGERVDTMGSVAGVAYIASGVLAAAGLTYALWPGDETKAIGQARVAASALPTGAAVVVLGTW
ncbi:hypothetical protein [Sorangium sp. So ce204]|uniref:hypothetical protein n=1 Tax=Sorangium sp. So ce204 TaxID=3133288 RepID=UPI003F5E9F7D